MYNQGYQPAGKLELAHYPAAVMAIARQLENPLFSPFAPEWVGGGSVAR